MLKELLKKWFGRRSKTTVIFALRPEPFELGWTYRYRHLLTWKMRNYLYFNTTTFKTDRFGYEVPWGIEKLTLSQLDPGHRISTLYVERLHLFFERLRTQSKERVLFVQFEMEEDMSAYVTQNSDNVILDYCLNNFKGYQLVKPTDEEMWEPVTAMERITLEEIYNASRRKPSDDPKGV